MFQNEFVRVYNVAVQPLDATLLHQHDLPYLALSLGPVDIVNAVRGKPEARLKLQDGDIIYSPGGFAHIARTDAGMPFNNVTVELAMPRERREICTRGCRTSWCLPAAGGSDREEDIAGEGR